MILAHQSASFLTTKEASERLRCSEPKVRSLIRLGRIRASNTSTGQGRPHYMIPSDAIDAFLSSTELAVETVAPSNPDA
jgi:excisionase family DNA binding protein